MKTLPINAGYFNYKSIGKQIFKSRIQKCAYDSVKTDIDTLIYHDETYAVGAGNFSLKADKTQDNFMRICVLNMLSRFTVEEETFKVLLTVPPLLYNSQNPLLLEYLKDEYSIISNGKKKRINIADVKSYPETFLTYIANSPSYYKDKTLIILDIGGLTTNGCRIRNGSFGKDDIFTIQNGMYHLDNRISQFINGKYYQNTSIDDIENYREHGLFNKKTHENIFNIEKECINNIYKEHIEKIILQCELKQWNLDTSEIMITGGGGKILFSYTKDNFFPQALLSQDPIYDNLNGLRILAEQVS